MQVLEVTGDKCVNKLPSRDQFFYFTEKFHE